MGGCSLSEFYGTYFVRLREDALIPIFVVPECPCDEHWIETYGPFEEGIKQPFYKTLICTKDRDPFMSIAAQVCFGNPHHHGKQLEFESSSLN